MSEQPECEPEPPLVQIEITADTAPFIRSLHRAHSAVVFATHPDLRSAGSVRPDEEPTP
ncbi:hypothetical protein [Streptomyces sp. NPDC012510]|uniref:hypothetical protein n=1 Tax=Streptomyces sp. NPDC012510 TaxID=3364838 RepID=UPI0036E14CE3